MGIVSLDQLRPGMVLDDNMMTSQGRMILKAGSVLSQESLKIARIWGVTEVSIQDDSLKEVYEDPLKGLEPELVRLLDALTEWRFSWCDREQSVVIELEHLFKRRVAVGLNKKSARLVIEKYRGPREKPELKAFKSGEMERLVIEDIVKSEARLASLPDVFHEIMAVVNSPTSSAAHIAEVISKDTSLSTKMLRLVNSSFYGFMSKIDTLSRAVTIVGTLELTNLALGIAVTSMFDDIPEELVDMRDFWEHSIAVGVIARILAAQSSGSVLERYFVGGLLHDIGRLILFRNYPEISTRMIVLAASMPYTLHEIEKRTTGFSHARLGGAMLREWKIPDVLVEMVSNHHSPGKSQESQESLLVHAADVIAHAAGFGHSGTRRVPPITQEMWNKTGLSVNILPMIISQAENQIRDLTRIIVQEEDYV